MDSAGIRSPQEAPKAQDAPAAEARGVSKTYAATAQNVRVLEGLDFRIMPGEFVAILGPSGSGKSTFLNILGLMDEPSAGEILLSGRSASTLSEARKAEIRNAEIGFLFQFDSLLPEFTVLENILLPARLSALGRSAPGNGQALVKARRLLEEFGLSKIEKRFPAEISGGEKQRCALFRALINSPRLLLADEPTGNLDKDNAELVFKDLSRLAREGFAVAIATHNEQVGRYADRLLRLEGGRLGPWDGPAEQS